VLSDVGGVAVVVDVGAVVAGGGVVVVVDVLLY